jgi:hypothetical protein
MSRLHRWIGSGRHAPLVSRRAAETTATVAIGRDTGSDLHPAGNGQVIAPAALVFVDGPANFGGCCNVAVN